MFAPGLKLPAGSCGGRLLIEENSWRTLTASNESMTAEFQWFRAHVLLQATKVPPWYEVYRSYTLATRERVDDTGLSS